MSVDLTKIQMLSSASSQKMWLQGTGSFTVPGLPGAGNTYGGVSIPHGFSTDNLIFQVATTGGPTSGVVLPWQSSDGRILQYAQVDGTNLSIYCISTSASSVATPGFTINYSYRLLIP